MRRLSDAQILYFDPPFSIIAPIKDKKLRKLIFDYRKEEGFVEGHITVYKLPPVLPFFNKYRLVNKINQLMISRFVKGKMKKHGFNNPVLWAYSPTSCDAAKRIPHSGLVYDCVDRHSAYKGMINPAVVDKMEEDLARQADVVFATALGLYETLEDYNRNTYLIPNGVDYELFSKAAQKMPRPEALSKIKGPIFGFVGMLQECISYDYIEKLLKEIPEATVVFIGRELPGVNLSSLRANDRAIFLPVMPQKELIPYIAAFDVCLNVFTEGKLSKDVSPLKFYEYLATGKPIVSTREPIQVKDFADIIYIAQNADDFVAKCRQAAAEDDLTLREKRMADAKNCSWDERILVMRDQLSYHGIL